MQREILFRGKDVKGNWHIGLLAHIGNAWYISNKAGIATAYEVIPSTVGQYTGLTDKNGDKIFEGDILKCSNNSIYIVEWDKVNARFLGFTVGTKRYITYVGREPKSEVIGSIHDNPELLEESE